jgi:hypothetical protein
MCKHEEIVTASRNAVVALRAGLRGMTVSPEVNLRINEEFSRRENAYDFLLESIKGACGSCQQDFRESQHGCFEEVCSHLPKRDFLRFVDEFVEHYHGGRCEHC